MRYTAEILGFDPKSLLNIEECIFCKWKIVNDYCAEDEHLINISSYTPATDSSLGFKVSIRSFRKRGSKFVLLPNGQKLSKLLIAPNRFDLVLALGTSFETHIELVYHIPNCYAGWIFSLGNRRHSEHNYMSLHNETYYHLIDRIAATDSVFQLVKLITGCVMGFSIVCYNANLFDKYTMRHILSNSLAKMCTNLKSMAFYNVNSSMYSSFLGDVIKSIDDIITPAAKTFYMFSDINTLLHSFASYRFKPSFHYVSHYSFLSQRQDMYKPQEVKISSIQGTLHSER